MHAELREHDVEHKVRIIWRNFVAQAYYLQCSVDLMSAYSAAARHRVILRVARPGAHQPPILFIHLDHHDISFPVATLFPRAVTRLHQEKPHLLASHNPSVIYQ